MKTTKFITSLTVLVLALVMCACQNDNDEPENIQNSVAISEGIIGEWLLASSDSQEWTVYEFKQSQLMTAEWYANKVLTSGTGMFFTNDENATLTATINDGKDHYTYLDWVAKKIQGFQVDIDIYGGADGNQFISTNSLYKIVGTQEIEYDSVAVVDYRKFTGTKDCTEFTSMDESIVTVDSSGKIESVDAGSTYVIFNTPAGHAALKVEVSDAPMSLSENILGTWVTDDTGYTWERDVFGEDGYFYAQWSREVIYPTKNESATGKYSVNDATKVISVSAITPYLQRIYVDYHITKIDRYSFNVDVYSGGDKTGVFYYQRVLASIALSSNESEQPNYADLVKSSKISGFSSHDAAVATVDAETGRITGVGKGITYIDVITNSGTGVVEVTVDGGND